jgi:putative transposase
MLRSGARRLIEQAVEAELAALLASHTEEKIGDGRARLVRHDHLPEREVMTGIGPVPVKVLRLRDRCDTGEAIRFTSQVLPRYLRKAKAVEDLLPWLYLKGISSGDFQEALAALLGPNAAGLSSTTISRLKAVGGRASRYSTGSGSQGWVGVSPATTIMTHRQETRAEGRRAVRPWPRSSP